MQDDELLSDIRETLKRSRTTFESVINKKALSQFELDDVFNDFK